MVGWKRAKGARPKLLVIAMGVAVAIGVLGPWWLGSQLVEPAPRAVPLPGDFPARALTIPARGSPHGGWITGPARRSSCCCTRSGLTARPCCPGPGCWSVTASRWRSSISRPTARRPAPRSRSAGASPATFARRCRGSGGGCRAKGRRHRVLARRRRAPARSAPGRGRRGRSRSGLPSLPRRHQNRIRMRVGGLAPVLTPLLLVQLGPRLGVSSADLEPPVDRPAPRAGARGGGLSR